MLQKELVQVQTLMDSMTREREEESDRLKNHYEQLQANYTNSEVRSELSNIISPDRQCSSRHVCSPIKLSFLNVRNPCNWPSHLLTNLTLPQPSLFGPHNQSPKMTYDIIQT